MPRLANPRSRALALCAALAATASLPASAGVAELLLKKGMITPDEYAALKQEAAAEAAAAQAACVAAAQSASGAAAPAAPAGPAPAAAERVAASRPDAVAPALPPAPAVSFTKGLGFTGIDGSYSAQFGTLMQLDAANYSDHGGVDNNRGSEMRRGRLYMQGTVEKDWQYKFEMELFGNTGAEVTDAYVRYNGLVPVAGGKPLAVTVGHFKIPFSFDSLMADKDLSLMERGLPNAFIKSRAPGGMLSTGGEHWTAAAMLFGEQLYSNTSNQEDEGGGASARLTWAPLLADGAALHFGAGAQYQEPTERDGGTTWRYASRPESHMTGLSLVDTGNIGGNVQELNLLGLEAAGTVGPLTFIGEYLRSDVERARDGDLDFSGWYAQAAWMVTGERRGYDADKGVFKGIQPLHPLASGGSGAWELVARYSELDLEDGSISGGEEHNATLGLGWYAGNYVRVSGNWVHVFDIDGGKYDGQSLDALQMRLQFAY